MNTNNQVVSMDQIQANVSVGMDDLVNVFIAKYETSLIDQRNNLQSQMKEVNKRICDLGETALKDAKEVIKSFCLENLIFENSYISVWTGVNDQKTELSWDKKHVTFEVETIITTHVKVNWTSTSSSEVTSAIDLHPDIIDSYNLLMEDKRVVLDGLSTINNELRDISRKERQIRGRIAERKFVASGLEDLLADQELAKLIQL